MNPILHMRSEMGVTQRVLAEKLGASKRQLQTQERAAEPRRLWVLAVRYLYREDQRLRGIANAEVR